MRGRFSYPGTCALALRLLVAAALLAALALPAVAGTRRNDVTEQVVLNLALDPAYDATGLITVTRSSQGPITASGTLISSRYILTAAHVVSYAGTTGLTFTVGGETYQALSWVTMPGWSGDLRLGYDLALVLLDDRPTVTAAQTYSGTSDIGATVTIVGYGQGGTGTSGGVAGTSGIKRAGQNVLDRNGTAMAGYSDRLALADFDRPGVPGESTWGSADPLALEYLAAAGDSGGGLYLDTAAGARLAGVVSFGLPGPIGGSDSNANADYGDIMGSMRITPYVNLWIDETITYRWGAAASGTYGDHTAWTGLDVPAAADIVTFNRTDGVTTTVQFDADAQARRARFQEGTFLLDLGGHTWGLEGDQSFSVGGMLAGGTVVTISGGTLETSRTYIAEYSYLRGEVRLQDGGPEPTLWHNAGSLYVGGTAGAAGGAAIVTVDAGTTLAVGGLLRAWTGSTVYVAGTLRMEGGTAIFGNGVLGLDTAAGGQFDLTTGYLVIDYAGASPLAQVAAWLASGYNAGGALWDGPGLVSSAAASDPQRLHAVGLIDNSDPRVGGRTTFGGPPVDATSILARYTWWGDINLDGAVNTNDYDVMDNTFVFGLDPGQTYGWWSGDLNGDGAVDGNDYDLIDNAFVFGGQPLDAGGPTALADVGAGDLGLCPPTALPEPASLGLLIAGLAALACRRRAR